LKGDKRTCNLRGKLKVENEVPTEKGDSAISACRGQTVRDRKRPTIFSRGKKIRTTLCSQKQDQAEAIKKSSHKKFKSPISKLSQTPKSREGLEELLL
jgi:hypothetical protein